MAEVSDPTKSNIFTQIAHIKNMGLYSRPTRFTFVIEGLLSSLNDRLVRNCQNLSLPGRALASQPLKIYGPPTDMVYQANYTNEIQMTFRIGDDMLERDFFEQWMNSTVPLRSSDISYPDNYMTSMKIYQLDLNDRYVYCQQLYNVFCKSVGDIELSTDSSDQIETVNIVLGYSEYQVVGYLKEKTNIQVPTPARQTIYPGSGRDVLRQTEQQFFGNSVLDRETDAAMRNLLNQFR